MRLGGDNAGLGAGEVELSETRRALPAVTDAPEFPRGVGGLVPILTNRRNKPEKTSYAFAFDASDQELESALGAVRLTSGGTSSGTDGVSGPLGGLVGAVALVNRMLMQARELSGHPFGYLDLVRAGVPETGWGFSRVEVVDRDAHGMPNLLPTRLFLETSLDPGSPDSLEAVVDYDREGEPGRLSLTERDLENRLTRVVVSMNERTGKLSVQKVEQGSGRGPDSRLLYKRGWQPRDDRGGRGDRPGSDERRGREDRGWRDDHRGWDDRGRRDDRRGRDDWRSHGSSRGRSLQGGGPGR